MIKLFLCQYVNAVMKHFISYLLAGTQKEIAYKFMCAHQLYCDMSFIYGVFFVSHGVMLIVT